MARTRILYASTLYGVATLAAALDAGCFDPADRTILLTSNNAAVPETSTPLERMPGFERLRGRFDEVLSWNETISPFHPGGWSPRPDDAPLWERHLRLLWGLGDDTVELVVESIQVEPALALVQIFTGAPVHVYADGLMSYGPTRNKLDLLVTTRIRRLLHLDLVPGLRPLLLSEHGVEPEIVPTEAFLAVLAELSETADLPDLPGLPGLSDPPAASVATSAAAGVATSTAASGSGGAAGGPEQPSGPALLLGQYLAALGILTAEEEEHLHVRMLRGAAALGHRSVVFKPHPTAPARWSRVLEKEAGELGVELTVLETPVLAEVLYRRMRPALVVGCFSTALLTAAVLHRLPVARIGTEVLLEQLSPYQNSNRVPVTVVHAVLPDLEAEDARQAVAGWSVPDAETVAGTLSPLVRAVGYCMQAQSYPHLRDSAVAYLRMNLDARTRVYFKRRRLTALALPGGVPAKLSGLPRNAAVRRVARRARALKRAAFK